jgi:3-oxoacyl-[acyl-carrier protein] reductase
MDLGIAGRKALVCGSSRGLGRACAERLAEAGCEVVVNGLDPERLSATAAHIRDKTGAKITAVAANVATREGQDALFAACPDPRSAAELVSVAELLHAKAEELQPSR